MSTTCFGLYGHRQFGYNIRGNLHNIIWYKKLDEISIITQRNCIGPQLFCFTEHHLKKFEIDKLFLEDYILASSFCRETSLGGGVCILINQRLKYKAITLGSFCHEKTFEVCAVKLSLESQEIVVLCIYRAPSGDLVHFFLLLEQLLDHLLQPRVTFIVCGDLNINLLSNSNEALKLLTLMSTYNLTQIVDFPTRIAKNSETLLDVLFIDTTIYVNVQIKPFINGLSDHDAQVLCLTKLKLSFKQKAPRTQSRLINDMTINSFLSELKDELWDQVINSFNTNEIFNLFLDTLIKHFEAVFPTVYTDRRNRQNNWISKGIRISCGKKRDLYTNVEITERIFK